jgi:hypothetical protein
MKIVCTGLNSIDTLDTLEEEERRKEKEAGPEGRIP